MGETTKFPLFLQDKLQECSHGHPFYPTSEHAERLSCATCKRLGFRDSGGRQTQKGKYHNERRRKAT